MTVLLAGGRLRVDEYAGCLADRAELIPELDVAAMAADMRPPTADDVPIALDGTRLDTPSKLIAYLKQINAARDASNRQRVS